MTSTAKPEMKLAQIPPRAHAEISADIDLAVAQKSEGARLIADANEDIKRLTAEMKSSMRAATGRKARVAK